LAGPCLAFLTARKVAFAPPMFEPVDMAQPAPPNVSSLVVVLLPVVLIAAGEARSLAPAGAASALGWLAWASNPVIALLLTNLVALPLLFRRRLFDAQIQTAVWADAMKPAGAILLAIGAGGALKQVLVSAGLSTLLAKLASANAVSPLVLGWLVAVCIRLATGSATVATITTVGVMSSVAAATGVAPEWMVLAIGAGSLFFSHVNDPGFWLVKSYVGLSTGGALRTWSLMETAISVLGLGFVLGASQVLR
jgi:gluconate:H+ symporter, GntP family